MSLDRDWLQVVAVPAVIASIPGGIGLWRWWVERADKKAAAERSLGQSAAEREDAARRAERELLTREQRETFERVEAERDRAIAERDRGVADARQEAARVFAEAQRERDIRIEARRDADRGWDLARWWNRRAQALSHDGRNAQAMASNLAARAGEAPPTWPDMTVPPGLEDPQ